MKVSNGISREIEFSRQARELLSRGSRLYPRSMSQRNDIEHRMAEAAWIAWELADARSIAIPVGSVAAPKVRAGRERLETLSHFLPLSR